MTNTAAQLRTQYGPVMSTEEVAALLKMSVAALRMARSRKKLRLEPLDIDWRRGQIYSTDEVAELISSWLVRTSASRPESVADAQPIPSAQNITRAHCS